jgi:hypothetical protein
MEIVEVKPVGEVVPIRRRDTCQEQRKYGGGLQS